MSNRFTTIVNVIYNSVIKAININNQHPGTEMTIEELKVKFTSKLSIVGSSAESNPESKEFNDSFEDNLIMTPQGFSRSRIHNDKKMTHTNVIFKTENVTIK
jgi:hypothetical protein